MKSKTIGSKDTGVLISFFPTKYAVTKYFEPKVLKDEPERIILDIKSGYNKRATDTLKVSR